MAEFLIVAAAKIALVLFVLLTALAYIVWLERKVAAHIQGRWGPYLVGPYGLLQPLADLVKFIFKEDTPPSQIDRPLYYLAPFLALVLALMSIAVIPFGGAVDVNGRTVWLQISDLYVGLLFIFAMTSMGVFGVALAGWSSGSKYSLLGGLRSSAQMISYELALGFGVVGVLILAGTLSLRGIVNSQAGYWFGILPKWYVFPQIIGFVVFLIAAFAETNRLPFDLAEAEAELVAGFHTEYSSLKFAMFFMAEYAHMVTASCLATILFFGGWLRPFPWDFLRFVPLVALLAAAVFLLKISLGSYRAIEKIAGTLLALAIGGAGIAFLLPAFAAAAEPVFWFVFKVLFFLLFYIWVRWSLPRFRYDQVMAMGWKLLLPVAAANILITGLVVALQA